MATDPVDASASHAATAGSPLHPRHRLLSSPAPPPPALLSTPAIASPPLQPRHRWPSSSPPPSRKVGKQRRRSSKRVDRGGRWVLLRRGARWCPAAGRWRQSSACLHAESRDRCPPPVLLHRRTHLPSPNSRHPRTAISRTPSPSSSPARRWPLPENAPHAACRFFAATPCHAPDPRRSHRLASVDWEPPLPSALQLPSVCDDPMRKKCKLTVLLMGGTDNPNALALASLFKLTFSYSKKEDAEGGIATQQGSEGSHGVGWRHRVRAPQDPRPLGLE